MPTLDTSPMSGIVTCWLATWTCPPPFRLTSGLTLAGSNFCKLSKSSVENLWRTEKRSPVSLNSRGARSRTASGSAPTNVPFRILLFPTDAKCSDDGTMKDISGDGCPCDRGVGSPAFQPRTMCNTWCPATLVSSSCPEVPISLRRRITP